MASTTPTRDTLLSMYDMMAKIRACDEAIRGGIARGELIFFYFPITGHEAIPTALSQLVNDQDYLVSTYRGFHHHIAKGVPFAGILGEMTGKSTALAGGKSGQMHICDPSIGVMFTSGIVGGTLPPAVGMALASKIRGDQRVTICIHGDGAINTGSFHEAMNMAAVWELPVVFICENNRFAETTASEHTYKGNIVERARSYGMPAEQVDGYDPVAVHGALSTAIDNARSGGGASLVEATCFRYFGHYFGDPMVSVPKDMLQAEMAKDPFDVYTKRLIESGDFEADELSGIKSKWDDFAANVLKENLEAAPLSAEGLLDGTYANPISVR